jgi:hypothetical protein
VRLSSALCGETRSAITPLASKIVCRQAKSRAMGTSADSQDRKVTSRKDSKKSYLHAHLQRDMRVELFSFVGVTVRGEER